MSDHPENNNDHYASVPGSSSEHSEVHEDENLHPADSNEFSNGEDNGGENHHEEGNESVEKVSLLDRIKDASPKDKLRFGALVSVIVGSVGYFGYDALVPKQETHSAHHHLKQLASNEQNPILAAHNAALKGKGSSNNEEATLPSSGPSFGAGEPNVHTSTAFGSSSLPQHSNTGNSLDISGFAGSSGTSASHEEPHSSADEVFNLIRNMQSEDRDFKTHVSQQLDQMQESVDSNKERLAALQASQSAEAERVGAIEDAQKLILAQLKTVTSKVGAIESRMNINEQSSTSTSTGPDQSDAPSVPHTEARYQASVTAVAPPSAPRHSSALQTFYPNWRVLNAYYHNDGTRSFLVETSFNHQKAIANEGDYFRFIDPHLDTEESRAKLQYVGMPISLQERGYGIWYLKTTNGAIWAGHASSKK